jgi:hypothetical protein
LLPPVLLLGELACRCSQIRIPLASILFVGFTGSNTVAGYLLRGGHAATWDRAVDIVWRRMRPSVRTSANSCGYGNSASRMRGII